ncbi:hypothetical protein FB451DRAFT_1258811 [Mycena latifolia]|nr:hypothetical protein FB451DRAFT_1258811 [Mycena latifolia]
MKLFSSLVCLGSIYSFASAGLTSHTIDDTHPSVKYNSYKPGTAPIRCSSNGCSSASKPDSNDYSQMINGTMTSIAGNITIPFTGTGVTVFFATMHKIGCAFHIDGRDVSSFHHNATDPAQGNLLGYSNNSLTNTPHTLSIISEQGAFMDFDGLVYLSDDGEASASNSIVPSPTFSAPSRSSHSSNRNAAIIIGSVVGAVVLLLLTALSIVILLRRRARGWRNLEAEPFPMDKEKSPSRVAAAADAPTPLQLEVSQSAPNETAVSGSNREPASNEPGSSVVEGIKALASVLRRASGRSGRSSGRSVRSAPPAYSDVASVS